MVQAAEKIRPPKSQLERCQDRRAVAIIGCRLGAGSARGDTWRKEFNGWWSFLSPANFLH